MSAAITRWSNSSQLPRRAAITNTWQSGTLYCAHHTAHTLDGGQYLDGWPPRKTTRSSDSSVKKTTVARQQMYVVSSSYHHKINLRMADLRLNLMKLCALNFQNFTNLVQGASDFLGYANLWKAKSSIRSYNALARCFSFIRRHNNAQYVHNVTCVNSICLSVHRTATNQQYDACRSATLNWH
jgi:hypothetical protein